MLKLLKRRKKFFIAAGIALFFLLLLSGIFTVFHPLSGHSLKQEGIGELMLDPDHDPSHNLDNNPPENSHNSTDNGLTPSGQTHDLSPEADIPAKENNSSSPDGNHSSDGNDVSSDEDSSSGSNGLRPYELPLIPVTPR